MSKSVITLGTFDGVHRGHAALLRKVVTRAHAVHATATALIFDMPPRHAGEPASRPVLLTTLAEKLRLIKALGVRRIQVLVFDRKTASTTPEDFFLKTIVGKHKACEMVVGPKVAFGKNRAGRLPLLRALGKQYGVAIHAVPGIGKGLHEVSSRRIRMLLAQGRLEIANQLLGYPYSAEGKVVHGDRRGRQLGFPTANIQVPHGKILPPGVYWVKVQSALSSSSVHTTLRHAIDGLCNVGTRPTFTPQAHEQHCEVFLLGRRRSLYGRLLRVVFMRRIRAEKRFASAEALKRQIQQDVEKAQLYRKAYFSI